MPHDPYTGSPMGDDLFKSTGFEPIKTDTRVEQRWAMLYAIAHSNIRSKNYEDDSVPPTVVLSQDAYHLLDQPLIINSQRVVVDMRLKGLCCYVSKPT